MLNGFRLPPADSPENKAGGSTISLTEGFVGNFLPLGVATALSIAVMAFDLATDWMTWQALTKLNLPEAVVHWATQGGAGHADTSTQAASSYSSPPPVAGADGDDASSRQTRSIQTVLIILPQLYFYFCVAGSVVVSLELVRCCIVLHARRIHVKNKIDGISGRHLVAEKLCGQSVALLQVMLEDLPLSALLLALQVAISCYFYVPLYDHAFLLSVVATALSVAWKLGVTCIRWRDVRRWRPLNAGGVILAALNAMCTVLLACTSGLVITNLLLLSPVGNHNWSFYRSDAMDKVAMDTWLGDTRLGVFGSHDTSRVSPATVTTRDQLTGAISNSSRGLPASYGLPFVDLISLKDLVRRPDQLVFVESAIARDTWLYDHVTQRETLIHPGLDVQNCSLKFALVYSPWKERIDYRGSYECQTSLSERDCLFANVSFAHLQPIYAIGPRESSGTRYGATTVPRLDAHAQSAVTSNDFSNMLSRPQLGLGFSGHGNGLFSCVAFQELLHNDSLPLSLCWNA